MAISLARYQVMIHADFTVFRQELRAEAARMAGTDFKVRPILDLTAFRAQFRVFEAVYLRDRTFQVTPHLNNHTFINSTNATFNQIIHNSSTAGDQSGKGFLDSFTKRWKLIGVAIAATLPLLQPVLSILGSLVQGAAAVGAALPLAFAGLALSVGTLVTVFHNLNKAITGAFSGSPTKAEKEAFDKLSDSAKKFVGQLLDIRTKLKGFQEEVQEQFFKKFTVGFQTLADSPAIKILRREMGLIAADAGAAASGVAAVFASSAQSGEFAALLAGIRGSFRDIASTLPSLTQMFLTLSVAAQPFVDILVGQLVGGLADLTKLVGDASKDGRLAKFFDDGLTAILAFSRLLINVGSIFKTIFDALTGGSDTVLGSLSVLTGQLATFLKTAQGQAILQLFADKLQLIGDIISSVLGPLLPLAVQLAQAISGPLGDGIRQILPALENLIRSLVTGLQPILTALSPIFATLVTVVADFVVLAIRELNKHISAAMPILQDLIAQLGPQLVPLVKAFGEALVALVPLIPALSQFILALLPLLIELIPLFSAMITVSTFLWKVLAVVIEWVIKLGVNVAALQFIFEAFGFAIGKVKDGFLAAWDAVSSWFTGTIVPSLQKAVSDIGNFFAALGRGIASVVSGIRSAWDAAWAFIRDNIFNPMNTMITQTIPNAFQRGVDFIGAQWDRLRAIARAPVDFFINTVINKGIVGAFNAVAGWIPGLGTVSEIHPPGFASGGQLPGYSDVDNMVAIGPGGKPLALAGGEWIINARQSRKHGGLLNAINNGKNGYADGGIIGAITDPLGWVNDRVSLDGIPGGGRMAAILKGLGTRMINGLVSFMKEKLFDSTSGVLKGIGAGVIGAWPSSPSAQRGDSGVWRTIVAIINATGPLSGSFGNAYRPGDPLWHGSGRAVDWMGFNQDSLAVYLSLLRPLELIHRTGRRDYAYTRGVNKGSFNNGLMEAHRNHIHIAMNQGGLLAKVFDSGGIMRPGDVGVNTGNRNELVLPEGMKVSLSDDTIGKIAQGIGRVLNGASMTALHIGRARA